MFLLFILGAAGVLALLASGKSGPSLPSPNAGTGITPGFEGQARAVRGESGLSWSVRIIAHNGPNTLVEVVSDDGRTGFPSHMVIRYVQQGSDKTKRFLAAIGPATTGGLVRSALSDFGVQGPIPTGENTPPNPSVMVPEGSIRIEPGSYQANISIGFPASLVASATLLQNGLAERGFTSVRVTEARPAGWKVDGDADYFVAATWPAAAKNFEKPKALEAFKKVA